MLTGCYKGNSWTFDVAPKAGGSTDSRPVLLLVPAELAQFRRREWVRPPLLTPERALALLLFVLTFAHAENGPASQAAGSGPRPSSAAKGHAGVRLCGRTRRLLQLARR